MPLDVRTIPCLQDNYAYLAHDPATGATGLIDIPEAAPIIAVLEETGWLLTDIFITHHHADHVDGLAELLAKYPARVIGSEADKARLPALDVVVREGDQIEIGSEAGKVIDVSGHTINHLAFHFPDTPVLFTADSLMALGCGRLFEGTAEQMYESLEKLAVLPDNTVVCSGHEYTASNGKFALTIEPDNAALISRVRQVEVLSENGIPTVPSLLADELDTNPFLRAHEDSVQAHLGMQGADPAAVFAEIRARKDNF